MQKKIFTKRLLIALGVLSNLFVSAQTFNGALRVYTVDAFSGSRVSNGNLVLKSKRDSLKKNMNMDGYFYTDSIPVGFYNITVSHVAYEPVFIRNIEIISGKSKELRIALMPRQIMMPEIAITAQKDEFKPNNELITLSSKQFDFSQTTRLPVTLSDPARVAQNMAGVTNNNDLSNNIIVRGNSPRYVQWNINGLEMPSPNHFIQSVGGGGIISMLSTNSLSNADFMTGAFPSEYGNALSGVFDIGLRKGSESSRESSVQAGMLGLEASTEGPFGKKSDKTYIVNYRYSDYGFLQKINLIDGKILPKYQDLTFNLNLPTKKFGTFTLFSINGSSSLLFGQNGNPAKNNVLVTNSGAQHKLYFNSSSYIETSILYSNSKNQLESGSDNLFFYPQIEKYLSNSLLLATKYNLKISSKQLLRIGVYFKNSNVDNIDIQHTKNIYIYDSSLKSRTLIPYDRIFENHTVSEGNLLRGFVSYKLRMQNITVNIGLHSTYFNVSKEITVEPRMGVNYDLGRSTLSFGAGLHSFVEDMALYKVDLTNVNNSTHVKMTKAWHLVTGYKYSISENCQFKIEPYFQYLYDVPDLKDLNRSLLNYDGLLLLGPLKNITNIGIGKNYGIEVSLERTFNKNYFFNVYASRYESKSQSYDIVYNTLANGKYSFVAIFGKEFSLIKSKKIGINTTIKYYGGTYYDKLRTTGSGFEFTYYYDNPTYERLKDYFRTDFQVFYSQNKNRFSYKITLDIFNITNQLNELSRYYDEASKSVKSYYQLGRIPVLGFKVYF